MTNFLVRECKLNELPAIIELLDREFVFNKQRSLSLCERFPNTLSPENLSQIRVAVVDGVVRGAHAIRLFNWEAESRNLHGAMIGMVWVHPEHRGLGIGSRLLSSTVELLQRKSVDFGVLWTGTPEFYERTGWFLSDRGLFGEQLSGPPARNEGGVTCCQLNSVDAAWLEGLRSALLPMRVERGALDYRAIPIPAVQVLCFTARGGDGSEGFALVGVQGDVGYFFEMVAPPILWEAIYSAVAHRFGRVWVNGASGEPFARWLAEKGYVVWRAQNKAMWQCFSNRVSSSAIRAWHIPYYDWV